MAADSPFYVYLPSAAEADAQAPDVLSVWQTRPGVEPGPVWEVNVAAARERATLMEAGRRVRAAERAIPAVADRLQWWVRQDAGEMSSFAGPTAGQNEAERQLAAWLAPQAESFAFGTFSDELTQALSQARRFSELVSRIVGQPVLVRSRVEGRGLGQTRISWTGDARTVGRPGLSQSDRAVHVEAVRLALATYQAWLRIATLVSVSAAQLLVLLPSGIGMLRALPAAWRYVTAVLAEYQRLSSNQQVDH
ncbi:MAG: hypothetical protein R3300_02180 [Candidatus Promineifilaceae bacterium]|nr:hypothetical protein [Candidatus Promineifilaceae bacterium]